MNGMVLIAFGFGWTVVAAIPGLFLGAKHENHVARLAAAAAAGDLAAYHGLLESYKWRSSVHGHGMLFSLSSIVIGFALLRNGTGAALSAAVVGTQMLVTVVWTLAAWRRVRPLMGLADLAFIVVMAVVAGSIAGTL